MLLSIHPVDPELRKIQQVVQILEDGGVMAYPTDAIYGLGCDLFQPRAIDRVCRIRQMDPRKALLTLICRDISEVSDYAHQIDNEVFRLMKKNLPGPFTFILRSGYKLPKTLKNRKGTIGVRVPNHRIIHSILEVLGHPILSTSLHSEDELLEYDNDPLDIHDQMENLVDLVIDGGLAGRTPTTVIDCTGDSPLVTRVGAGELRY